MKIAIIIIRVLIGVLFLFTSIGFFLKLFPEPEFTGNFKAFQLGLIASNYLIPLAKSVELLCGLAFVTNRYVTLANILILPVTVNILFINFFLSPEGIPLALFVFFGNLFLIYSHWKNYKGLFVA
ncbi:DoxX family membrane protein [Flavobacterium eburneipallidum]|uniref:DoxX family membrane protein n=1 Tax=Flavobacterium eburneipallidum TaxID=3003263 RepID=UPI0022AC0E46|nr:DoxX family membrane protein [Flavobacterium eburneipallidum]